MILLLLACSEVDPEFARDRADAICARHAACDTLGIAGFASEEACKAALRQAAEDLGKDQPMGCTNWSPAAAEACLAAYAGSCEEPPDLGACTAVCGG